MGESNVKVLVIQSNTLDLQALAKLADMGVEVIMYEPQTETAEDLAGRLLDVQAKQIGKGSRAQAGSPWFRQFEKRGRHRGRY